MTFTDNEIVAWYKCYVADEGIYSDPHTSFMNLIGTMCRSTAKQKAYTIAYSIKRSDIIRAYESNGDVAQ